MAVSKAIKKEYYLYGGLTLLTLGAIWFFTKDKNTQSIDASIPVVDETQPLPPIIDQNKVLSKGSDGAEVKELQKLMGISADGIFGNQTESRLLQIKGVKAISLNQYKNSPSINQNTLAIGARVMSNIRSGTPIYFAYRKDDGSYYSDYEIWKYIDFGKFSGTIKGRNAAGNWYLVTGVDLWGNEQPSLRYFVKASEVKKI